MPPMLYLLSRMLQTVFGPFRLLGSYAVLIGIAIVVGFFATLLLLPRFYRFLPKDRGREFTVQPEACVGKPTGSGIVFISFFIVLVYLLITPSLFQSIIIILTWCSMMTGFLDDRAQKPWNEYTKGLLDLIIAIIASIAIYVLYFKQEVQFWFPFTNGLFSIPAPLFFFVSIILIWFSINTTNCSDGVDGLSGMLVLMALCALGGIFYFVLGNTKSAQYLLVPNIVDGAQWAVIIFSLAGVLIGYIWHNAHPSSVLMGDAGSRSLGFFIAIIVIVSKNPFLMLMSSPIILINGGTGLLKVAFLRFLHIPLFKSIRFPLHDHMRKNKNWSATQVLIKFIILQFICMLVFFGILFKIR